MERDRGTGWKGIGYVWGGMGWEGIGVGERGGCLAGEG